MYQRVYIPSNKDILISHSNLSKPWVSAFYAAVHSSTHVGPSMEWNSGRTPREEANPRFSRVLVATSGNAQSISLQPQQCDENYDSFSANNHWQLKSQDVTLRSVPSNDRRALLRQKLNERRIKRRIRLAEKYLHHPRFIAFKARPRKDVCKKTQEVIWTDDTETAFQNAIINIPAMGRKKKSQHGKTFGRNELIMEWIKQETGKTRTRKQVSSHMQTLDKMFEPKPEEGFGVRMLTRATDDSISDYDEPEFYENSIADMVRNWRKLQHNLYQPGNGIEKYHSNYHQQQPAVLVPSVGRSMLSLDFAMWVSHPDRMKKALHRYTRIQSSQTTAAPEPLENIQEWRSFWPALASVVDRSLARHKLDVILLEAGLELMLDFPPPGSKLASSLELEFATTSADDVVDDTGSWQCSTWIYNSGILILEAEHKECHSSGPSLVKPPFESRWWAEQFTRLTERHRHAADTGDAAVAKAAEDIVQDYLSNLTIMQHVSRRATSESLVEDVSMTRSTEKQQGAILLWRFSQVASKSVGTTTWRRLILPPQRMAVNSPIPSSQNMELPALDLDTNVDNAFASQGLKPESAFLTHDSHDAGNAYMPVSDEELCQDGYMIAAQQNSLSTYMMLMNPLDYKVHNHISSHGNMLHSMDGRDLHSVVPHPSDSLCKSVLCAEHYRHYDQPLLEMHEPQHYNSLVSTYDNASSNQRSEALLSFDVNTSRILQAQLEESNEFHRRKRSLSEPPSQPEPLDQKDYAEQLQPSHGVGPAQNETTQSLVVKDSDQKVSAQAHAGSCDPSTAKYQSALLDQYREQVRDETKRPYLHIVNHDPPMIAPKATRPTLHHHHTYAGVLPTLPSSYSAANVGTGIDDITTRHDFTLLIDNIYGAHDDFFDQNLHVHPILPGYRPASVETGMGIGLGITRACSQPPPTALFPGFPILMSNDVEDETQRDGHGFVEEEEMDCDGLMRDEDRDGGGLEDGVLVDIDAGAGIGEIVGDEADDWVYVKSERV